ncbi:MAG: hypothetical protein JO027_13955 [Solirubrobacterales bacterium]|nr:hypothetical protein [Solirubrobacterales bacterium]
MKGIKMTHTKVKMTRRLGILVGLCVMAALAFTPSAGAAVGCNAANLVPASQAPPQWAELAPAFCIHRTTEVVTNPGLIPAAHAKGYLWCMAWSQKPTTPWGFILNQVAAAHFCSSRAWYYVEVLT